MTSKERCKHYRRRILDLSQQVSALHIGGAFSAMEIVDVIYNELMLPDDTFIMSKGHGWLAQAVILEERGLLDLSTYCTPNGMGVHPDLGIPGITCATGSLGHGLGMACGIALANRSHNVYIVLSDGECMAGSTWEAVLLASSLDLDNIIAVVDNNDLQSLGRTSEIHKSLYPLDEKFRSFGWGVLEVDGHDSLALKGAIEPDKDNPSMTIARTKKGYPISFMLDQPIWHYRSPTKEEYQQALKELETI
jgi:transketolase